MKFMNLEKLMTATVWVKIFAMKVKKYTEINDALTAQELLENENI